jgi:predicted phosphodiesterase
MQRLAVVSDIHGNLPALEAVLADAARHAVDATVNLGDIASGPLWPRETVALLQTLGLPTIAGNHERQVLAGDPSTMGASDAFAAARLDEAQRAWLRALPATLRLDDVHLCHGTPDDDLTMWLESLDAAAPGGVRAASATEVHARSRPALTAGATLVLCGHSHVARVLALDAATVVVNPGSVGLPAWQDDGPPAIGVETGSPHARYAIVERGPAGWDIALRAVAYDWHAAARRAEAGGRPEWAHALATGRNPIG